MPKSLQHNDFFEPASAGYRQMMPKQVLGNGISCPPRRCQNSLSPAAARYGGGQLEI